MEYLQPSTGKCGSTLMTQLIAQATGREICYAHHLSDFPGAIKKTHSHFTGEPTFDYRAVFVYGHIGDGIAQLYFTKGVYDSHLVNLQMRESHRSAFYKILGKPASRFYELRRFLAFAYLVWGDKFRFNENIESWKKSKHTLFIKYEDWMMNKETVSRQVSRHLGIELPDFQVVKRSSSENDLPPLLRLLILWTYPSFYRKSSGEKSFIESQKNK